MTRSGFGLFTLLLLPAFAQAIEPGPYTASAPESYAGQSMPPLPSYQTPSMAGPGPGYAGAPADRPAYGPPGHFAGGTRAPWSRTYYGRRLSGDPADGQPASGEGAPADASQAGAGSPGAGGPAYGGAPGYGAEPLTPCEPGHPGYPGGPAGAPFGPGYYPGEHAQPGGPGYYRKAPATADAGGPELRIERDVTDQAYIVRIHTRTDVDPATVDVQQRGRQLLISVSRSNQANYQNDQAAGYRNYSFSYSRSMGRRFNLPHDADASAMQRRDEDGTVTLTFPRNPRY